MVLIIMYYSLLNIAHRFAHRRTIDDMRISHALSLHQVLLGSLQNYGRHLVHYHMRRNSIVNCLRDAFVEHTMDGDENTIPDIGE